MPKKGSRGKYRPPWLAEAIQLRARGWSYYRIAWRVNVNYSTARYWVDPAARQHNLEHKRRVYNAGRRNLQGMPILPS